jgi:PAS domain S-box-containing protein
LEAIVQGVEQLNPAMICSILLLSSDGKHLGKGVAPSLPDFYNAALDGVEIGVGVGSCGTAAFTGERVIVEDISTHPYWVSYKELASRAGLGACWSQPIRSSTGQVLGTFAIYHHEVHMPVEADITLIEQSANLISIAIERKQDEEAIRQSEIKFRTLYDSTSDAVQMLDEKGFFDCNKATLTLFGCATKEEFCAHHPAHLSPPKQPNGMDSMDLANQHIATAMKEGSARFEWIHTRADTGQAFSTEVLLSSMKLDGKLVLQATVRDITERKHADDHLRLISGVFDHAAEGILITDKQGTILEANPACSRITGYSREEILGKNSRILHSGRQDQAFYDAMWREILENGHWSGEVWNRRKNGEIYPERLTLSAVKNEEGETSRYIALFSDISNLKNQQQQLERLAHHDAPTQPDTAQRPFRDGDCPSEAIRRKACRMFHGSRRFQAGQRHFRPRGGRFSAC